MSNLTSAFSGLPAYSSFDPLSRNKFLLVNPIEEEFIEPKSVDEEKMKILETWSSFALVASASFALFSGICAVLCLRECLTVEAKDTRNIETFYSTFKLTQALLSLFIFFVLTAFQSYIGVFWSDWIMNHKNRSIFMVFFCSLAPLTFSFCFLALYFGKEGYLLTVFVSFLWLIVELLFVAFTLKFASKNI